MQASNTALKEGEFNEFITPDNSSKRKVITFSSQELEDIMGFTDFQTPQLSSSKGTVHIKTINHKKEYSKDPRSVLLPSSLRLSLFSVHSPSNNQMCAFSFQTQYRISFPVFD
ncbi:hypothetical protein RIF29_37983 [Crotalaria pallida]|uniref:Uncharacterized protein n=1 Tax=Crotalaria pallida TaxID=3830 RepID=A0AAN9HND0_CROPI